jgi:hypothetical protein
MHPSIISGIIYENSLKFFGTNVLIRNLNTEAHNKMLMIAFA